MFDFSNMNALLCTGTVKKKNFAPNDNPSNTCIYLFIVAETPKALYKNSIYPQYKFCRFSQNRLIDIQECVMCSVTVYVWPHSTLTVLSHILFKLVYHIFAQPFSTFPKSASVKHQNSNIRAKK